MRIALDASAAAKKQRSGIGRYAAWLMDALFPLSPDDEFVVATRWSRFRRGRYRYKPRQKNACSRYFDDRGARFWLGNVDLFHGLDARIPTEAPFPCVATVHDVAPAVRPDIASAEFRSRKLAAYELIAERAWRIICVSAATRDSFRRLFDVPEHRFKVIHHGLEPRFTSRGSSEIQATLDILGIRQPYILFVGLLATRKNLETLVRAFDRVAAEAPDLSLVLAGGRSHGILSLDAEIEGAAHRNRIHQPGFVDDLELPMLYAGAKAFVFPGLTEGFGMPILEAMGCGAPVIAADNGVGREVAGDAALLVDTAAEDDLANAIRRVALEEGLAQQLRERGLQRAAEFTWKAAAEQTLQVYREVVHEWQEWKEG